MVAPCCAIRGKMIEVCKAPIGELAPRRTGTPNPAPHSEEDHQGARLPDPQAPGASLRSEGTGSRRRPRRRRSGTTRASARECQSSGHRTHPGPIPGAFPPPRGWTLFSLKTRPREGLGQGRSHATGFKTRCCESDLGGEAPSFPPTERS